MTGGPVDDPVVRFEHVSKAYEVQGRRFDALTDVSLDVARGTVQGLVGWSGAGKSTLLRTVNALERPTSGRVVVDGREVSALRGRELYAARQRIGMVFQQFNLLQSRTVYANVAYPLRLAGLSREATVDRVEELLDFVGLGHKALEHPARLSGGQKQRVGIARALATRPDVLLSDEATSALDPQTTHEVLGLLRRAADEQGVTILLVTHEMDVVRELADRVAVLQDGRIVESGTVYDVFSSPRHATSRRFVASVLQHRASPDALARLRTVHTGRLVRLHVTDRESNDPFLSRVAREHGVDYNVVHGGISELQARTFGEITLELLGDDDAVDAALRDLARSTTVEEVDDRA